MRRPTDEVVDGSRRDLAQLAQRVVHPSNRALLSAMSVRGRLCLDLQGVEVDGGEVHLGAQSRGPL